MKKNHKIRKPLKRLNYPFSFSNFNFKIVGALGFAETGTILDTYKVFLVAIQERRR